MISCTCIVLGRASYRRHPNFSSSETWDQVTQLRQSDVLLGVTFFTTDCSQPEFISYIVLHYLALPLTIMPTKFKLNTGAEIPAIGFGTWQDEQAQEDAVAEAIKTGYRHIDTARV